MCVGRLHLDQRSVKEIIKVIFLALPFLRDVECQYNKTRLNAWWETKHPWRTELLHRLFRQLLSAVETSKCSSEE